MDWWTGGAGALIDLLLAKVLETSEDADERRRRRHGRSSNGDAAPPLPKISLFLIDSLLNGQ